MTFSHRPTRLAAVAALAIAAAAGCGPGGRPGADPSPSAPAAAAVAAEFTACVRANGVPGFPDLAVTADGLAIPEGAPELTAAAQNACKQILAKLPAGQRKRAPSAADRPKLLAYARCLRANGIPEWPDPGADGVFPLAGTPLESEGKSARMRAATSACREHWDGGIPINSGKPR